MSDANSPQLKRLAESKLPTRWGDFRLRVYRWYDPNAAPDLSREPAALVAGNLAGQANVAVRVHSECLTSEVFGSSRCDCKAQLEAAQRHIQQAGTGVVIYLRQEGRGIGLANKIRAYALQDTGVDTVEANHQLKLPIDARSYEAAAAILRDLGVQSINLMTNNPKKQQGLESFGIEVLGRIPIHVDTSPQAKAYLETKRRRLGHLLP